MTKCGCEVWKKQPDTILFCPLHRAAPEMLDCLKGAMMIVKALSSYNDTVFVKVADRAISRAEGKGTP